MNLPPAQEPADLRIRARAVQASAAPAPSPCVSVCRIDEARGWCTGCLRTLDEIAGWAALPDPARRVVWARIAQRAGATSALPPT